ncbi:MAG: alpha/beta fold hydrolase [Thermanaerothrix sp.]|uniref:Alpha/beta hydrolase n=1 Tax=Thermanaerothrix solaris TaxID=3058434 RepID=A0ABU3NIP0_9CHLR|nr:alpha/beta hydrolase [Thermanaerothrix sp. 4228-RoL]MDT8896730.1 alpha/beta hydrolase [Thermanaerothrix sp. 4228-RoL]
MKIFRLLIVIFSGLMAVIVIVPLLIPIPPLPEGVDEESLAWPDSQFIEIHGLKVHYQRYGKGNPAMILLHGFGASTFSWREVIKPLGAHGTAIAFDRPGFGLTERPLPQTWEGKNPYTLDFQADLVIGLMDALDIPRAFLIGNSAGGTVAFYTALKYPQRVEGLVLVDAAIYRGGGAPAWIRPLLDTPQMNRLGPWFVRSLAGEQGLAFLRSAWHDPSKITDEIIAGYRKPLQTKNWDRALWELTKASQASDLAKHLSEVSHPVLVITGDDDRIVPTEESIRLAQELPNARLVVIPDCGHVPQEECPAEFLHAVLPFVISEERNTKDKEVKAWVNN